MMRSLLILVFAAGCSTTTLHLANGDALNRSRPTTLAALHEMRLVRGQITDVSVPWLHSPSLIGDKATVTASVPQGAIPGRPEISSVALKYDCDGVLNRVEEGSTITFVFLPDGRFVGVLEWTGVELTPAEANQLELLKPSSGGDLDRPRVTP
jgi:hypothetical protein